MRKKINMVLVPKLKKLIQGTGTKIIQLKKAFTLVELIVVITILAILATVGFVSFSGYLVGTRDTNRIAQLKSMSDALELYRTKKDLPIPDDKVDVKVGTGSNEKTIAYQGYIGKNVLETIEYTESGLDPKDKNYFSYYLTKNKKYFQLLSFLEEPSEDVVAINNKRPVLGTKNIALKTGLRETQATDYSSRYPKTTGKKLGILTDENNTPIQEIPAITGSGYLDIETTSNNYIANISSNTQITGTGSKLIILEKLLESGGKILPSCNAILKDNSQYKNKDGVYLINPEGNNPFEVYCDMTTEGGGWTLIFNFVSTAGSVYPSEGILNSLNKHVRLFDNQIKKIALISSKVRIQEKNTNNYVETKDGDDYTINQLRNLNGLGDNILKNSSHFQGNMISHLDYSCNGNYDWPSIYHACGNHTGFHMYNNNNEIAYGWTNNKLNMEVMIR